MIVWLKGMENEEVMLKLSKLSKSMTKFRSELNDLS